MPHIVVYYEAMFILTLFSGLNPFSCITLCCNVLHFFGHISSFRLIFFIPQDKKGHNWIKWQLKMEYILSKYVIYAMSPQ